MVEAFRRVEGVLRTPRGGRKPGVVSVLLPFRSGSEKGADISSRVVYWVLLLLRRARRVCEHNCGVVAVLPSEGRDGPYEETPHEKLKRRGGACEHAGIDQLGSSRRTLNASSLSPARLTIRPPSVRKTKMLLRRCVGLAGLYVPRARRVDRSASHRSGGTGSPPPSPGATTPTREPKTSRWCHFTESWIGPVRLNRSIASGSMRAR